MGPESDPDAVVDQYGRVYGTDALVVADASVMPNIVRCNTNLTSIMIGERMADWLRYGVPAEQPAMAVAGVGAAERSGRQDSRAR
jgi:choline dehydrogenase-like flavoprotein